MPTEIPLSAKFKNPQDFHECTLQTQSAYISVAVTHLIKEKGNQAFFLKKIPVPYFADAVRGMKKSKQKSPKKSPKKRVKADGDQPEAEVHDVMV